MFKKIKFFFDKFVFELSKLTTRENYAYYKDDNWQIILDYLSWTNKSAEQIVEDCFKLYNHKYDNLNVIKTNLSILDINFNKTCFYCSNNLRLYLDKVPYIDKNEKKYYNPKYTSYAEYTCNNHKEINVIYEFSNSHEDLLKLLTLEYDNMNIMQLHTDHIKPIGTNTLIKGGKNNGEYEDRLFLPDYFLLQQSPEESVRKAQILTIFK